MDYYNHPVQQPAKEANASYQPVTANAPDHHSAASPASPWRSGVSKRLPWTAFLALFFVLVAVILMIVILVRSNHQPAPWAVQPAVLLALAATFANILIAYALSEGVAVAWWVKSMNQGTQISDLHNIWSFGTSLKSAVLSGRAFNLVALAGILVSITPINAPLLQRATSVSAAVSASDISLSIPVAQEFPFGYTGVITGRGHVVALTTANFSTIVRQYSTGIVVNLTDSGCNGRCTGTLRGAGYAINCASSLMPYDLNEATSNGSINWDAVNGTSVFSTNFTYSEFEAEAPPYGSSKPLNFTALYKSSSLCDGNLNLTECTLIPALMEYNIVLNNNTISLDPAHTYQDDRIIQYTPPKFNDGQGGSSHGGMALALNGLFSSVAHLRFTGAVGYELLTTGAPAIQYPITYLNSSDANSACQVAWGDPTNDMLGTARQLAFRVAIAAANASNATNIQTLNGVQQQQIIVYNSHYIFLGLAILLTLLSTCAVVPIFFGWWRLGRNVSMSPVEIAKAFGAPALVSSDSNATAKELLREVGERQIRYGACSTANIGANGMEKLAMGDPEVIHEPVNGNLFSG